MGRKASLSLNEMDDIRKRHDVAAAVLQIFHFGFERIRAHGVNILGTHACSRELMVAEDDGTGFQRSGRRCTAGGSSRGRCRRRDGSGGDRCIGVRRGILLAQRRDHHAHKESGHRW